MFIQPPIYYLYYLVYLTPLFFQNFEVNKPSHYQTHTSTWTLTLFWLWGALMPMTKHITFLHEQVMFNFQTKVFKVEWSNLGYACLVTGSDLFVYQPFGHQQVFGERWFYTTLPKFEQVFSPYSLILFVFLCNV
jgi:hypothetical protein